MAECERINTPRYVLALSEVEAGFLFDVVGCITGKNPALSVYKALQEAQAPKGVWILPESGILPLREEGVKV